jgi:perosamine synthetase
MAVFNSLGSNYSGDFILKSMFVIGANRHRLAAEALLKKQYGGDATLVYKGRQALELALRQSGLPKGAKVGINGFTCFVVYQAVERAGYTPVFLDVEPHSLHYGVRQLQANQELAAIIVQNTLGLPAPMEALEAHCKQQNIMIIEDLAHSMGAQYSDGREAGTVGDLVMLTFSQDKPLDVVAGGALIDRRAQPVASPVLPLVSLWQQKKNRSYPFWTALIRGTYGIGLGRYIHFGLKKLHLLATPMSDNLKDLQGMSRSTARLLTGLLQNQAAELGHRQDIAAIYQAELPKDIQYSVVGKPSYVRFPIAVDNRSELIEALRRQAIHIGDTWYDAPVAPKRYLSQTSYQSGQCPEAEELVTKIVNLPTHKHVTPEVAHQICAKIKQCLQPK